MNSLVLWSFLKSKYCIAVFFLGLLLGYLLVPKTIFYGLYYILGFSYIIIFSLVLVCIVRTIKDKINNFKSSGAGILTVIASIIGFSAMQVCGVGAPVCGAGIGMGLLSVVAPQASFPLLNKYSLFIIIFSLVFQIFALYYMGCFKKCGQLIKTKD
jgi:hypothetical protein